MKKVLICLALISGFSLFLSAAYSSDVSAQEVAQPGSCADSPAADFPYRLLCPHAFDQRPSLVMSERGGTPAPVSYPNYASCAGSDGTCLPPGSVVSPGAELSLKASLAKSSGSNGRRVMVWITAQGSNESIVEGIGGESTGAGFTELGSGGNNSLKCPGVESTSGARPGPVYGEPGSPAQFTGDGGISNCLYGKMLFYDNVQDSRNEFNFKFRLGAGRDGTVCFRTTVSMAPTASHPITSRFPASSLVRYNNRAEQVAAGQTQEDILASWIVKQSEIYCYTVPEINEPPTGAWYISGCNGTNSFMASVGDPNRNNGNQIKFHIVKGSSDAQARVYDANRVIATEYGIKGDGFKPFNTDEPMYSNTFYSIWIRDYNSAGLELSPYIKENQVYRPSVCSDPNVTCDNVRFTSVTSNRYWRIFKGSVTNANEIAAGGQTKTTIGQTLSVNIDGDAIFGQSAPGKGSEIFILRLYKGTTNDEGVLNPYSDLDQERSQTGVLDCVDSAPTAAVDIDCSTLAIAIGDNDSPGGVAYRVDLYRDGGGSPYRTYTGAGSGYIQLPAVPGDVSASNAGWSATVTVTNAPPGDAGATQGNATASDSVGSCYVGSCSIGATSFRASATGTIPNQPNNAGVIATRQLEVDYTLSSPNLGAGSEATNRQYNNPLYSSASNATLSLVPASGANDNASFGLGGPYAVGQSVPIGGSVNGSIPLTAPSNAGRYTLQFKLAYAGLFDVPANRGAATQICSITIDVFRPFKVKPRVTELTPTPNLEDPLRIEYTTSTIGESGSYTGYGDPIPYIQEPVIIDGKNSLSLIKRRPAGPQRINPDLQSREFNDTGSPAPGVDQNQWRDTWDRTYPNPSNPKEVIAGEQWEMGDQFCARIDIPDYNFGWSNGLPMGAGARMLSPEQQFTTAPGDGNGFYSYDIRCGEIINNPYVRAYGGDVRADGVIEAFTANPAHGAGSGSEFGVISAGATSTSDFISGFYRENQSGDTTGSFNPANGAVAPGGLMHDGATARPANMPIDYYNVTIKDDTKNGSATGDLLVSGNGALGGSSNNQSLHAGGAKFGGSGAFGGRHAAYVAGNAIITGNIELGTGATTGSIPAFAIVAQGDIYISKDVTRLDGVYSAGGKIYTCAQPGLAADFGSDVAAVVANCQSQLVVNGALSAREFSLDRAYRTLRDMRYALSGTTRQYRPREVFENAGGGADGTFASEAIRMTPDVLLSQYGEARIFRSAGSQTGNKYDYIVTLPPIL